MNAHKIEINSEINDILAGDLNEDNFETNGLNYVKNLLKANKKMKNKLLKIRNEMIRNNQDLGQLVKNRKLTKENSQGQYFKCNKLCKLNKNNHHHRTLITYEDLDTSYYTMNEESLCHMMINDQKSNKILDKHKLNNKTGFSDRQILSNSQPTSLKSRVEIVENNTRQIMGKLNELANIVKEFTSATDVSFSPIKRLQEITEFILMVTLKILPTPRHTEQILPYLIKLTQTKT